MSIPAPRRDRSVLLFVLAPFIIGSIGLNIYLVIVNRGQEAEIREKKTCIRDLKAQVQQEEGYRDYFDTFFDSRLVKEDNLYSQLLNITGYSEEIELGEVKPEDVPDHIHDHLDAIIIEHNLRRQTKRNCRSVISELTRLISDEEEQDNDE